MVCLLLERRRSLRSPWPEMRVGGFEEPGFRITGSEIGKSLKRLKSGKAATQCLRSGDDVRHMVSGWLVEIYNVCLDARRVSINWRVACDIQV